MLSLRKQFHQVDPIHQALQEELKGELKDELAQGNDGTRFSKQAVAQPCKHLYEIICKRRRQTADPTGDVRSDAHGEALAQAVFEAAARDLPGADADEVREEAVERIYTDQARTRVTVAHQWVLHTMSQLIQAQPATVFNPREKRLLLKRIRDTKLELPPPASLYDDEKELLKKAEVYYERMTSGRTRMRVGGGYLLSVQSWFNLVFTVAHELAHSIDPCELRVAQMAIPAFDRLHACFVHNHLVAARPTRAECGRDDQLSETFADWMAVQVSAEALRAFAAEFHGRNYILNAVSNSVRDLCTDEAGLRKPDEEFHPSPRVRIEKIFGSNPEIRQILGCPAPTKLERCELTWSPPSSTY